MKQRCVIIGSGLGGLSCAYILAKQGYQVTVLEKNAQPGGCLQCFKRGGAKFEAGMHFIGSADENQTLGYLMKYLSLDKDIELQRLNTQGYDVIGLAGSRFKFANGREPFIETMASYFPKQKDNLVRYFDLIEAISQSSSLHSLDYTKKDMALVTQYHTKTVGEVIDSIITDKLLRNVLCGNIPLYAAEKDKTPFS